MEKRHVATSMLYSAAYPNTLKFYLITLLLFEKIVDYSYSVVSVIAKIQRLVMSKYVVSVALMRRRYKCSSCAYLL